MHVSLEQPVAIKEYYPDEWVHRDGTRVTVPAPHAEEFTHGRGRFTREGQMLAKLNHPGIVRVSNHFEEHGTAYLVMDLIRGRSLRDELNDAPEHRLPEARVREIMAGLVEALAAVHAANLLHLDIKPENILLNADRNPILVDFGAARRSVSTTSSSSARAFTAPYAPIELMNGDTLGPGSDLFELAMLLHELLTGVLPPASWDRLLKRLDPWTPELAEPWKGLIASALPLELEKRAGDVREWWKGAEGVKAAPAPPKVESKPKAAPSAPKTPAPRKVEALSPIVPPIAVPPPVSLRDQLLASIEWVAIPAGAFKYGKKSWFGKNKEISLPAFLIMKYPVTVTQYRLFCGATGRTMPDPPKWGWHDTHPIVSVSWHDASAFAKWAGLALPTEEEWEKAASGTDGREYPWGDTWDASKCQCSKKEWGDAGSTAPVGRYPTGASPYGVLDMAGNVWEWCDSWYSVNSTRVLHGGSWLDYFPDYFRARSRRNLNLSMRLATFGFRCVSRSVG